MSKIEIGTIVTLILAIIGGALWIGDLNGRLKSLEAGGAIVKLQNATEDSIEKIRSQGDRVITSFEINDAKIPSVPVGTIIGFAGEMTKETEDYIKSRKWLLCDGSHLSKTEYQILYQVIGVAWGGDKLTFNLPDFRGIFLRGVSGKSNRDPEAEKRKSIKDGGNFGNQVGSYQEDQFQGHKHKDSAHTHTVPGVANNKGDVAGGNGWDAPGKGKTETLPATCKSEEPDKLSEEQGAPRYGQETRSKNAYVYWLIKCE